MEIIERDFKGKITRVVEIDVSDYPARKNVDDEDEEQKTQWKREAVDDRDTLRDP